LRYALVPLVLGVVFVVAGCDMSAYDEQQERANDSRGPGRSSQVVDSPIVGEWHTSSVIADFMYSAQKMTSYGGGGTGEGYCFRADGTYTYYIVTSGYGAGTMAGWVVEDGRYQVDGTRVILSDRYASFTNTKDPSRSYRDKKEEGNNVYEFALLSNDELEIQNSVTYVDGSIGTDVFTRSHANTNFDGLGR